MKALARAIIFASAFLELSDDETLDPDNAARELENISYELQKCNRQEKAALKLVLQDLIRDEQKGKAARTDRDRQRLIEFYENFMATIGLEQNQM